MMVKKTTANASVGFALFWLDTDTFKRPEKRI